LNKTIPTFKMQTSHILKSSFRRGAASGNVSTTHDNSVSQHAYDPHYSEVKDILENQEDGKYKLLNSQDDGSCLFHSLAYLCDVYDLKDTNDENKMIYNIRYNLHGYHNFLHKLNCQPKPENDKKESSIESFKLYLLKDERKGIFDHNTYTSIFDHFYKQSEVSKKDYCELVKKISMACIRHEFWKMNSPETDKVDDMTYDDYVFSTGYGGNQTVNNFMQNQVGLKKIITFTITPNLSQNSETKNFEIKEGGIFENVNESNDKVAYLLFFNSVVNDSVKDSGHYTTFVNEMTLNSTDGSNYNADLASMKTQLEKLLNERNSTSVSRESTASMLRENINSKFYTHTNLGLTVTKKYISQYREEKGLDSMTNTLIEEIRNEYQLETDKDTIDSIEDFFTKFRDNLFKENEKFYLTDERNTRNVPEDDKNNIKQFLKTRYFDSIIFISMVECQDAELIFPKNEQEPNEYKTKYKVLANIIVDELSSKFFPLSYQYNNENIMELLNGNPEAQEETKQELSFRHRIAHMFFNMIKSLGRKETDKSVLGYKMNNEGNLFEVSM
jgi:hypothetical protein